MIRFALLFALALLLLVAAGVPTAYVLTRAPLLSVVLAPLVTALTASAGTMLMLLVGGRMIWWTTALFVAQYAAVPALLKRVRGREPHSSWVDVLWCGVPLLPPFTMVFAPPVQFDANSIWWLHAIYFAKSADVARDAIASLVIFPTHPDYPPLASAPVGVVFNILGYDLRVAQFASSTLTFSAIAMLSYAVRRVTADGVPAWVSRLAGVLVALTIWANAGEGVAGGMSDALWTAAFAAGAVLVLLPDRPFARPVLPLLLLSVAALTKNEGFVAVLVLAPLVLLRHRRTLRQASLIAMPVLAGAAWSAVARVTGARSDLANRFPLVFSRDPAVWDRFEPTRAAMWAQIGRVVIMTALVAVVGAVFLHRRRRALKIGSDLWLWVITGAYVTILFVTYLVSPYDVNWHLVTSVDRATLPVIVIMCTSVAVWGTTAASRRPADGGPETSAPTSSPARDTAAPRATAPAAKAAPQPMPAPEPTALPGSDASPEPGRAETKPLVGPDPLSGRQP